MAQPKKNFQSMFLDEPKKELEVYQLSEDEETKARVFRAFINEEIIHPAYYNQLFLTLATAKQDDIVELCFNSGGGQADTAIEAVSYIKSSNATVLAHIVGQCHSAASIMALSCDGFVVYPYASMLCHTYSSGVVGKRSDVQAQLEHEYPYFRNFFDDVYGGFMNKKELDKVWKGTDLWLNAKQIQERLDRMAGEVNAGN